MSEVREADTPKYDIYSTEHDNELVEVKESSIGLGVFALEEIEQEELVGYLDGEIIKDPNYESDCCVYLEDDLSLEPVAPFRFLNHSCQPNCRLIYSPSENDEPPTIWVEAIEAITPGMELTIDYSWSADSAIPCKCGSPECRGWIVAEDQIELIIDRQASMLEDDDDDDVDFCLDSLDDDDDDDFD